MFVRFCAKIGEVDIAIFQTGDRNDFEPGHNRAGRIGAVRRGRDETDVSVRFSARRVILANREQARKFALRSGIGLQRNRGESRDFSKPLFELLASLSVAARLIAGRERMQVGNLRPRDRKHLRGRIEFHRAGTERNHRRCQRQIARFELFEITQHFCLGVVAVEDRMSKKLGSADCGLRNAQRRLTKIVVGKIADRRAAKDGHQQFDIARRCRFVE